MILQTSLLFKSKLMKPSSWCLRRCTRIVSHSPRLQYIIEHASDPNVILCTPYCVVNILDDITQKQVTAYFSATIGKSQSASTCNCLKLCQGGVKCKLWAVILYEACLYVGRKHKNRARRYHLLICVSFLSAPEPLLQLIFS
jgi:hypothetical protein